MSARWYVSAAQGDYGPLTDEALAELVLKGTVRADTLIRGPGFDGWLTAGQIPELAKHLEWPAPELNTRHQEIPISIPKLKVDTDEIPVHGGSRDSPSSRSYLVRHWRGDLSLALTYWVNSFLGTLAVLILFSLLSLLVKPSDTPAGFAVVMSFGWLFTIAVTLWQLVGVWRSAGKHRARGGKAFWAGAARFMVFLGFVGLASSLSTQALPQLKEIWNIAFGDPEIGPHEVHILRGGTELEYAGGITFGATEEVRKLLDADPAIRVVHLNSPGGRVAEARELRDLIRQRGLITYTATICASACTLAFLGGAQRFIAPEAKLGFHRGSFPGLTDEQLASENDADRQALVAMGVAPWFADRAYSTPSNSMWWPTSGELTQAGILTGIATPDDFALSGGTGSVTEQDLDSELRKNALYVAIKSADPEVYSKILKATMNAVRLGNSEAELVAVARPYISGLSKRYLPVASDAAVISTAQLAIFEAEAIGSKSADACYDYFYPRPGSQPVVLSEYLSPGDQQRDLAITAAVIETGSSAPQPIPTRGQVDRLLNVVISKLLKTYSTSDIEAIEDPRAAAANHQKACRMDGCTFSRGFNST